jgi:hypothetical protein
MKASRGTAKAEFFRNGHKLSELTQLDHGDP